jgi:serine/threonine protein kinase
LSAKLPDLEVLELTGHGGMGAVYKARQRALDRVVAVKVLPIAPAHDAASAERFAREARALAKLSHPNIVAVYDFGRTDDLCHFVMEFVEGVNLRHMIAAKTLTPPEALRIVPQICDALQYAHDEGVVHRDIKPENILLDRRGRVKIADFGLAKLITQVASAEAAPPADVTLTMENHVLGTPRYMAPEQVERPAAVDHRADIYSLGVVFYEMLTGELPMGRFAPPSQKVQLDVRLDDVVLRTLEKEPARRYQQASHITTDLGGMAAAPLPPAQPVVSSKPSRRGKSLGNKSWFHQSKSDRRWTKGILWALVALGAFLAFSFEYHADPSRRQQDEWRFELGVPRPWLRWKHEPDRSLWRQIDLNIISWSFGGIVTAVSCGWSLMRIARIESRRRRADRAARSRTTGGPSTYTLPPGSAPVLALAGGGLVVSGIVITAGLALAALAFARHPAGSNEFWGWMGGAIGCVVGGAGAATGSWNTYRQLLGRGDLMTAPGHTALDRALEWYTTLGAATLVAVAAAWRAIGPQTRHAALLIGGLVFLQGVLFLAVRATTRARRSRSS